MSALEIGVGLAVLAGAMLQSTVGFGFALVAAPLVFAALESQKAVGLMLVLSLVSHVMILGLEGRRPQPLLGDVVRLVAWGVPGLIAGVLVLRSVDARVLQVMLTVAVFGGLVVQHLARRMNTGGERSWWAAPVAGLSSGALTTSTTTGGPPLVLYLRAGSPSPTVMRDSLITCFMAMALLGALVLWAFGAGAAVPPGTWVAALVPVAALGQLLGRRGFARLQERHYELVLTVVLVVSASVGLVTALA